MGTILSVLLILALAVWAAMKAEKKAAKPESPARVTYETLRCPNCGAEARVCGNRWECGWCGDFGACTRE